MISNANQGKDNGHCHGTKFHTGGKKEDIERD